MIEIRHSLQGIQVKSRHSMRKKESEGNVEEYDIYGNNEEKIDEEKIKAIGNLLTVMNMDNRGDTGEISFDLRLICFYFRLFYCKYVK